MARKAAGRTGWKLVLAYGLLLALGTFVLEWLDYQRLARTSIGDIYTFLVAAAFLAIGIAVGARALRPATPKPFDGNPAALASLGISARELAVLEEMAAGRSNKEIAIRLGVSPNTVKTHAARLFEKLEASRRTDAIARARALGIVRYADQARRGGKMAEIGKITLSGD